MLSLGSADKLGLCIDDFTTIGQTYSKGILTAETVSIDIHGNATLSQTVTNQINIVFGSQIMTV